MGGGSSSSNASNVTNDNDVMASDNAIVMGEAATYSDQSIDVGMGATLMSEGSTAIDVGMGGTFLSDGATDNSGNDGVITGGDFEDNSNTVGMGGTLLEAGAADNSGNSGYLVQDGSTVNSGILMGDGSSYIHSEMDEDTAGLLDNALNLMYANTENVLEIYAAENDLTDSDPVFMNPSSSALPSSIAATADAAKNTLSTPVKIGIASTLLLVAALAVKYGGNNNVKK